ncbi:MAG: hypothetical protein RL748_3868 [Pseudomonadota bacterium]|jgi:septal ring factor EnvC (AmiA/AmiB activator)
MIDRPRLRFARFACLVRSARVVLLSALLASVTAVHAVKPTERSRQKAQAETERAQLQQKLRALKQEIGQTEAAKEHAADTLAESEAAISDANRSLRDLVEEQRQIEIKRQQLLAEQQRLLAVVAQQQSQLSKLLRQHYVAGKEDRVKLLLSGDNPNRIERDLQFMGYLSKAQAAMLASLRENLAIVEQNQIKNQDIQDELEEIAQEQREQKTLLEQEKSKRKTLLVQLSTRLSDQRKQAGSLEQDEQRMSALVSKLEKLIAEQLAEQKRQEAARLAAAKLAAEKKAAAARLAAEQAARLAEKNRSHAQSAKAQSGKVLPAKAPIPAAEPEQVAKVEKVDKVEAPGMRNELLPASTQEGNFASLRGKLRLPLRGTVSVKFGSKRDEGPSSKGLFIRSGEGAEVKAVANGRVVFAEWLRGFGNLLIVDHGAQYLTIYGNNQSLLKRAGDAVKIGDTIAYAGNSGGNEESGLYFEMRHQSRAFDPMGWISVK